MLILCQQCKDLVRVCFFHERLLKLSCSVSMAYWYKSILYLSSPQIFRLGSPASGRTGELGSASCGPTHVHAARLVQAVGWTHLSARQPTARRSPTVCICSCQPLTWPNSEQAMASSGPWPGGRGPLLYLIPLSTKKKLPSKLVLKEHKKSPYREDGQHKHLTNK